MCEEKIKARLQEIVQLLQQGHIKGSLVDNEKYSLLGAIIKTCKRDEVDELYTFIHWLIQGETQDLFIECFNDKYSLPEIIYLLKIGERKLCLK